MRRRVYTWFIYTWVVHTVKIFWWQAARNRPLNEGGDKTQKKTQKKKQNFYRAIAVGWGEVARRSGRDSCQLLVLGAAQSHDAHDGHQSVEPARVAGVHRLIHHSPEFVRFTRSFRSTQGLTRGKYTFFYWRMNDKIDELRLERGVNRLWAPPPASKRLGRPEARDNPPAHPPTTVEFSIRRGGAR